MSLQQEIKYEIAQANHREGILHLVKTVYRKQEPIEASINQPWDEVREKWEEMIDGCINSQCSHVASLGDRVVGYRLSRVLEKKTFQESAKKLVTHGALEAIMAELEKKSSEELKKQPANKILYLLNSCVDPEFENKGIARTMCIENLRKGYELGCGLCVVVASNSRSQTIFEKKLGFTTIGTVVYSECLNPDGTPRFNIQDPSQKSAKIYMKTLPM